MKLKLPLTYDDVTVRQLQTASVAKDDISYVAAFLDGRLPDIKELPKVAVQKAYAHLRSICDDPNHEFVRRFEHDGKQYGFVPDWSKFTAGEYIDMEQYAQDPMANADKLMALLYRPITEQTDDDYEVAPYTAHEDSSPFLDMPAKLFGGAMLFFWSTRVDLFGSIQSALVKVAKQMNSAPSGDGTPSSTPLQESSFWRWMQLPKSRLRQSLDTSHS
jgi:hypothetical protein